ncbi:hypothetical protein UNSW3_62 [Campylobacter concisus UNSW3]|uniref:Uncharacterized protein n=1 Tax=Campylobacter concisus UNSW3 TaxID=1242966 RepID=U2EEK7_9BACT|nr:hypothetical protein UNSWCD_886 [Campylobacter concisus UNSWCD]ERJ22136.1 hypothetical protein UNSW3_62 [Campylobacter concisus UNSW3]
MFSISSYTCDSKTNLHLKILYPDIRFLPLINLFLKYFTT